MPSQTASAATRPAELSPLKLSPATSRRDALVCAVIYVALFAVVASILPSAPGFPLDDSWIHLVIARNLAQFHVFGFLPGHVTTGSTSLLWTALLFAEETLLPHGNPVVVSALLSAVILAAIGYNLRRMTDADGLDTRDAWLLSLAPAISGNFLWLGLIGMEHLLFVLLSILTIRWWYLPAARSATVPRSSPGLYRVQLALLCCLLGLARPEGFFLVALLIVLDLHPFRLRDSIAASAGSAVAVACTVIVNRITAHRFLPQTLEGRRYLISPHITLLARLRFLQLMTARLLKIWSFVSLQFAHGLLKLAGALIAVALVIVLLAAIRELYSLRSRSFTALVLWGAMVLGLYFFILPAAIHGGRYLSPFLLVYPCLILLGVKRLLLLTGFRPNHVWAAVLVFAVLTAARSVAIWRAATGADIQQINSEHGAMAQWIEGNLPPEIPAGEHLAAFDIGRLGYQFHGSVIDLGGLVDNGYLPYLRSGRVGVYLQQHDVSYVVLPTDRPFGNPWFGHPMGLDPAHGVTLTPVHAVCAAPEVAELAATSTGIAARCQSLYRITYASS